MHWPSRTHLSKHKRTTTGDTTSSNHTRSTAAGHKWCRRRMYSRLYGMVDSVNKRKSHSHGVHHNLQQFGTAVALTSRRASLLCCALACETCRPSGPFGLLFLDTERTGANASVCRSGSSTSLCSGQWCSPGPFAFEPTYAGSHRPATRLWERFLLVVVTVISSLGSYRCGGSESTPIVFVVSGRLYFCR